MPDALVNGIRLHYEERGIASGPPVLLHPGLGGHHIRWSAVARYLDGHYRLVLLDPRDAGESGQAPGPYGIVDMAGDAIGLLDHLGIGATDVVGLSMGGAVAEEMAISHPERVRRLVLLATYDTGDPRGTAIFRQLARLRQILAPEDYLRTLLPWVYTHEELSGDLTPEEMVQRMLKDPYDQEPDAYERQMEATLAFHSRDRLYRITCPTLLLFGEDDLFTPLRFARSLHSGIQGSRLVVLAGAGHGLTDTRAGEVAALIDEFLQEEIGRSEKEAR